MNKYVARAILKTRQVNRGVREFFAPTWWVGIWELKPSGGGMISGQNGRCVSHAKTRAEAEADVEKWATDSAWVGGTVYYVVRRPYLWERLGGRI